MSEGMCSCMCTCCERQCQCTIRAAKDNARCISVSALECFRYVMHFLKISMIVSGI